MGRAKGKYKNKKETKSGGPMATPAERKTCRYVSAKQARIHRVEGGRNRLNTAKTRQGSFRHRKSPPGGEAREKKKHESLKIPHRNEQPINKKPGEKRGGNGASPGVGSTLADKNKDTGANFQKKGRLDAYGGPKGWGVGKNGIRAKRGAT